MERWFFRLLTMLYLIFLVAGCGGGHGRTDSPPEAVPQTPDRIAAKKVYYSETFVFGQMVRYAFPEGFIPVYAKTSGPSYIQELVPQGESTERWSQMITLSGTKGLARNPHMTPKVYADMISSGFRWTCPESFARSETGAKKIGGCDAYTTIIGCGAGPSGEPSESVLLIVIAGDSNYYTLQWAEKVAASQFPMHLKDPKWTDRLQQLSSFELLPPKPEGFYMFGY